NAAYTRQALAVFLVAWIIEPAYSCALQERRIAIRLEDLGYLDPVGQLRQLPRSDDESRLVETALQSVLGGIDFILAQIIVVIILIDLSDDGQFVGILQVEQQLDGPLAPVPYDGFPRISAASEVKH